MPLGLWGEDSRVGGAEQCPQGGPYASFLAGFCQGVGGDAGDI